MHITVHIRVKYRVFTRQLTPNATKWWERGLYRLFQRNSESNMLIPHYQFRNNRLSELDHYWYNCLQRLILWRNNYQIPNNIQSRHINVMLDTNLENFLYESISQSSITE